jgi:hypothetical protein
MGQLSGSGSMVINGIFIIFYALRSTAYAFRSLSPPGGFVTSFGAHIAAANFSLRN